MSRLRSTLWAALWLLLFATTAIADSPANDLVGTSASAAPSRSPELGISIELFLPNDFPSLNQSMQLLGPDFILPLSKDDLELFISYGNGGNVYLLATQLNYHLNVYTPFLPLYFLFGGSYYHYSAKELVGLDTGMGINFEMAKGFFMGLNMKVFSFLQEKMSMSFGGGFRYSL